MMNTVLWIAQGLGAMMFMMAGMMKIRKPKEEMAKKMGWVEDFSQGQIKTIGMLEVLASIGLILPWGLDILSILTPIAAIGLAMTMIGAMITHAKRKESKMLMMNLMLFAIVVFVAYGRFAF